MYGLTNEALTNNGFQGKIKIPDMCRELEVRCISLTTLLKEVKPNFILDKKSIERYGVIDPLEDDRTGNS